METTERRIHCNQKTNLVLPVEAAVEEFTVEVDHVLGREEDEQLLGRTEPAFPEHEGGQDDESQLRRNDDEVLLQVRRRRQRIQRIFRLTVVDSGVDKH